MNSDGITQMMSGCPDVRALIELAKARALAELGIVLEEEVIYLGFENSEQVQSSVVQE